MNKKWTVVLLALMVLLTMTACRKKTEQPVETTVAVAETETTAPAPEETTEPEGFSNEAIPGEPAPFDAETAGETPGTSGNQNSSTDGNSGSSGNKNSSSGSNSGSSGNNSGSSGNKKPSSGSNSGSSGNNKPQSGGNSGSSGNNKPQSGGNTGTSENNKPTETLPPEVEVDMGVVEGENDGGLEEDFVEPGNQDTTRPTDPPKPTEPPKPSQPSSSLPADFSFTDLTYEAYNAMTGEQQQEVIEMFASPDVFVRWYKAAEAQYKAEHPDIEIGADGSINAGDLKG